MHPNDFYVLVKYSEIGTRQYWAGSKNENSPNGSDSWSSFLANASLFHSLDSVEKQETFLKDVCKVEASIAKGCFSLY